MGNNSNFLMERLTRLYEENPYVKLLEMKIVKVEEGYLEITMPILENKHTNLYRIAHGGALASLADTIMGVACVTMGKKVVTLEMNINFVKAAPPEVSVRGIGKITHNGKSTMIAEGKIVDSENNLIALSRGTFFVTGEFEELKTKE